MTRTITALLAVAMIAGVAAPAAAQTKYFARERIVGMETSSTSVAYVPTYSGTYGTCMGGTKSRPISSCAKSDGTPASLSDCSSFPQTTAQTSCTIQTVCGMPQSQTWFKNGTQNNLATGIRSAQAAQDACNTFVGTSGKKGVCAWDNNGGNGSGPAYFMEGATTYNPSAQFAGLYASTCQ